MTNISERDKKIERNAGDLYMVRKLFFIMFVFIFIGLIALIFTYDNPEKADEIITSSLAVTIFWFLVYKLADYRIQHIYKSLDIIKAIKLLTMKTTTNKQVRFAAPGPANSSRPLT